ncbi:Low temperature viability protein-domain-containing protein [Hyaloraphidium curvatum]|nr:Low temperature viability protein-domain-containing protein [Hyaloraphidium curvatum]
MGRHRKAKPFIDGTDAGTRHYRLVHRSQRDPLQADETASKMVLQAVPRSANLLSGKRAWQDASGRVLEPGTFEEEEYVEGEGPDYEVEGSEDFDDEDGWEDEEGEPAGSDGDWETDEEAEEEGKDAESAKKGPAEEPAPMAKPDTKGKGKGPAVDEDRIGQAPLYGIFLDDREYDYTKHLKPIGEHGDAVFVAARKAEPARKTGGALEFREEERKVRFELPEEVLPSTVEDEVGLLNRAAENKNLMLEVDPDVREVLYALEDEAYVDEELDDDFFGQLDSEEPVPGAGPDGEADEEEEDPVWGDVKRFKKSGKAAPAPKAAGSGSEDGEEEDGYSSEGREDGLSKFSMTSSALFRNKHLTLLDDRFDKMLQDEYDEEDEDEEDGEEDDGSGDGDHADNPEPTTWTRAQMTEHILSQFLAETSLQGRSLIPSDDPMEEMDTIRTELKAMLRPADLAPAAAAPSKAYELVSEDEEDEEERRWDVETVLTTYSNAYNHPAVLDASAAARRRRDGAEKIEIDANGIPVSWLEKRREEERRKRDARMGKAAPAAESDGSDGEEEARVNKGAARTKGESKEEKKARKEAVKEEKRAAREQKKQLKEAFRLEKGEMAKTAKQRAGEKGRIRIA